MDLILNPDFHCQAYSLIISRNLYKVFNSGIKCVYTADGVPQCAKPKLMNV